MTSKAFVRQLLTHTGFPLQRSHLTAAHFLPLYSIKIAFLGQTSEQMPQTLHSHSSTITIFPLFLFMALAGHASMQGAGSQWTHNPTGSALPLFILKILPVSSSPSKVSWSNPLFTGHLLIHNPQPVQLFLSIASLGIEAPPCKRGNSLYFLKKFWKWFICGS